MHWHRHSAAETIVALQSARAGLSGAEAARRLAEHGPNVIVEGGRRSWLALLVAQFLDVPILVLLGAVVIAVALQLAIIYLPVLNRLFHTQPLDAPALGVTFAGAVAVLMAVEFEKRIRRART
jgi:magnesium-transporting ATPase (P-type)